MINACSIKNNIINTATISNVDVNQKIEINKERIVLNSELINNNVLSNETDIDVNDEKNNELNGVSNKNISSEKINNFDNETSSENLNETKEEIVEYEEISKRKGENKMVITYFSASGYTKKVAKVIENYFTKKGKTVDFYEIEPKDPYSEKDLDYMDKNSRCCKEYYGKLRPELLDHDFNIEKHEVIFVGFPVWWGESPQIIYSFLESYDFTDKTIVPFCVSHSSPLGKACSNLSNYTNANLLDGIRFSMDFKEEEIEKWLDNLNLN